MSRREELVIPQVLRRFAFDEWGGIETVVWNTVQQLQTVGVKSEILATQALCNRAYEELEDTIIRRFAYTYPYLGLNQTNQDRLDKKGGNPISFDLLNYLLTLPRLDLIHCHTMARMGGMVRYVAQKRKIPYIVSFHGGHFNVPVEELEDILSPLKNTFHFGKVYDWYLGSNRFIKDADGIITVGYDEYLEVKKRFPHKATLYLPNGVDPDRFSSGDPMRFRQKHGIDPERKILLSVARVDPQKNQLFLLELLRELSDTMLVLIGPATNLGYMQTFQQESRRLGLEKRVLWLGNLPHQSKELVDAYHAADVFVLPSIHEPFGIVVLEAWAAGLPVVAANIGGLKKLINHDQTGFLCHSIDDYVAAINALFNHPVKTAEMIQDALSDIERNYTWKVISQKLFGFYAQIIADYIPF